MKRNLYLARLSPRLNFYLLPLLFLLSISLPAQEQPFRVGVVLSGGGAKGYAHVGALKVLEEAGIRIDYIGGASAGAIVGGLYAAGWKAEQLDSFLHLRNMGELIQEHTDRSYLPFFEKQYGEKYALSLSFKDFKPRLPQALSNGQELYDFFSALTIGVSQIQDFSQLPIPFFCTGTDVVNGKPLIFEHGVLARDIRASGAFPGLLAPIEVNGELVSDGGILNNFPVREMQKKGVDFIIGVNLEEGLLNKSQLNSMEKIISQIGSFQEDASTRAQIPYCNLLIQPNVKGFNVASFNDVDTLINLGESAARSVFPQLLEIAQKQKAAPAPVRYNLPHAYPPGDPFQIDHVHVDDNPAFTTRTLLEKFPVPVPGVLTFDQFRQGIASMYATDNFHFIDYEFGQDSAGCTELRIHPVLNEGYDNQVKVGLHYDKVYRSSLLINATFRNRIFKNSLASIDLIIGDKFRYDFHYLVDLGRMPDIGFNSRLNYTDLDVRLPVEVNFGGNLVLQSLKFNIVDFNNEIYANFASGNSFETGIAAEVKYFKTSSSQAVFYLTEEPYIGVEGLYGTAKVYYHFDNRDRTVFSRAGSLLRCELRATYPFAVRKDDLTAHQYGLNADLRWSETQALSRQLALRCNLDAGINLGTPATPYRYLLGSNNQNLINNFRPFIGLPFGNATGDHLISPGCALQWQVYKSHYLTFSGNLAWIDDTLKPFSSSAHLFRSAGISYGFDSPLGPLELTYGYAGKAGSELYFNLGFWF